jgi:hypothetical protein
MVGTLGLFGVSAFGSGAGLMTAIFWWKRDDSIGIGIGIGNFIIWLLMSIFAARIAMRIHERARDVAV